MTDGFTDTIDVRLVNEGVECWRPVLAERLAPATCRIAEQPYDADDEMWEFTPGSVVAVTEKTFQDETRALAAHGQATSRCVYVPEGSGIHRV